MHLSLNSYHIIVGVHIIILYASEEDKYTLFAYEV